MAHASNCIFVTLLAVLGLFSVATKTAAGRVETVDGKTVIRIVTGVPEMRGTDAMAQSDLAAIRLFEQRFADIFKSKLRAKYEADPIRYGRFNWEKVSVEVVPFSPVVVEGVETDLMAIAGGIAPDVLYVNFRKSDNYIGNGFLHRLDRAEDNYLAGMSKTEVDFRVHPKLWEVIQRRGPQGEKGVWALPYGGTLGKVLFYRKSMFDERGEPYPTERWTWNDLLAAARRLTDPARGTYGVAFGTGKHESWYWLTFLWSAGGEVMTYDEPTDTWRCVFDSDAAVTALDFYTRLTSEKWIDSNGKTRRGYAYRDTDIMPKWDRGEVAMIFANVDGKMLGANSSDAVGMVPVPFGPTGERGSELNSQMMGLYSGIQSPVVRDVAWEFMKFIDSEEAMEVKTRTMVENGYGQFVNPKYLRQFGYTEIERLATPGLAKTYEIAVQTGKPEPYGKNSNFAYDLMTEPLQQAQQLSFSDQLPADESARRVVLKKLLSDANARANELMIGIVSPHERSRRNILAMVMLASILIAFVYVLWSISRVFTAPAQAGGAASSRRRATQVYLLLLPALGTIFLWQYVPLGLGSVMAFQEYHLVGESTWVGLQHFGDLIVSSHWWQAIYNSLRYSLLVIALTFVSPIILAILLQEVPRGKIAFRTIFYLPAVVTGLVVTLLWKQFYEPSEAGMLNAIVMAIPAGAFVLVGAGLFFVAAVFGRRLWQHEMRFAAILLFVVSAILLGAGISMAKPILMHPMESWRQIVASLPARLFATAREPYRWVQDSNTAMLACVIPMVWAGIGPGCLIYLAALKGIPDDYYEAADLDGANFIDKILFVVFPTLKPLIVIQFVGAFIGSFYGASSNILAMTAGAANTEVADLHIWYRAFAFLNFGSATAMAWMLGFLLIGFTVYQLRILSRMEFRAAPASKK